MSARYTVQSTLNLDPLRAVFLLVEYNRPSPNGTVDRTGQCVGEYPSIEMAIEAAHGKLLQAQGAAPLLRSIT